MSEISELLAANRGYADAFTEGNLTAPPRRRMTILTCMDARIDPVRLLGLKLGDAHVIRNAGGRIDDGALRSLIVSQQMLDTNEIVVIHHTECGLLNVSNDDLRQRLADRLGADASDIDFLPFSDLAESVREDIAAIRRSRFIPSDVAVSGFIYDIRSGRLQHVE